ncbi:hypothetical protein XM38_023660 [Halomicronema hongdechloris C2206]|uniref:Orc1-like AAA ATPase domain-containing protein n=1 Tax=Halomicronema hongdechloris C2206 TaxID=1641165 RepID=A0A1Z3HM96_9CYAN|nr:AAA family ATPase [Halomicronema hongdechloris]ASC71414.1 hypothetical protein XM38_023660 [Halomicronema hongdechloris C2206]
MSKQQDNPLPFVGRKAKINKFQENLERLNNNNHGCLIFNISGQAGIGKTELLEQFYKRTIDQRLPSAKTNFRLLNDSIISKYPREMQVVPAIMAQLAEELEKNRPNTFREFQKRYQIFCKCLQKLEASPNGVQWDQLLSKIAINTAISAAAQQFPFTELPLRGIDKDEIAKLLENWMGNILSNQYEAQLMREPLRLLSPLFLKGLNKLYRNHPIALFFDDYEQNDYGGNTFSPDQWLRDLLFKNRYGQRPKKLLIVIAGRQALNPLYWRSNRESNLLPFTLEPFTEAEVREYLSYKVKDLSYGKEALTRRILNYSDGFPLIVSILADQALNNHNSVIDPCEDAVRYILSDLDPVKDDHKRQLAVSAALSRRFDKETIEKIIDFDNKIDASKADFDWLIKRSFIVKIGLYRGYHRSVRKFMLRYLQQLNPSKYYDLHERLASHYSALILSLDLSCKEQYSHSTWWLYRLEWFYHRFCQTDQNLTDKNFEIFEVALEEFFKAFDFRVSTATHLAKTIRQAGEENQSLRLKQFGEALVELVKHYQREIKILIQKKHEYRKIILSSILIGQTFTNPVEISGHCNRTVKHIIEDLEDSQKVRSVLRIALSRNFDYVAFRVITKDNIVRDEEAEFIFRWLTQLPFVTLVPSISSCWEYNPLIRKFILRRYRKQSFKVCRYLHANLTSHYSNLVQGLDWNDINSWSNLTWQNHCLECLYHRLHSVYSTSQEFANNDFALGEFAKALKFQQSRVFEWAQTIQQVGEENMVSKLKNWGEKLVELIDYPQNLEQYRKLEKLISSSDLTNENHVSSIIKKLKEYLEPRNPDLVSDICYENNIIESLLDDLSRNSQGGGFITSNSLLNSSIGSIENPIDQRMIWRLEYLKKILSNNNPKSKLELQKILEIERKEFGKMTMGLAQDTSRGDISVFISSLMLAIAILASNEIDQH